MSTLFFALSTTIPILTWLIAGVLLRRFSRISDSFMKDANYLVFTWALPGLLFLNIGNTSIEEVWDWTFLGYAVIVVVISIPLLKFWFSKVIIEPSARGVAVQGAYRGNMNVVGLAMVVNAFGISALPLASIMVALMTLLFNVTAVFVLQAGQAPVSWRDTAKGIVKNPIIIGVFLGTAWSLAGLSFPAMSETVLEDLGGLALPLALLCIGATLRGEGLKARKAWVLWVSLSKLVVLPLFAVAGALLLGFRGEMLGILYILMAAPTAAASYVMAKAMTNWGQFAAEIIAVTTVLSIATTTVGLLLLRSFGFL